MFKVITNNVLSKCLHKNVRVHIRGFSFSENLANVLNEWFHDISYPRDTQPFFNIVHERVDLDFSFTVTVYFSLLSWEWSPVAKAITSRINANDNNKMNKIKLRWNLIEVNLRCSHVFIVEPWTDFIFFPSVFTLNSGNAKPVPTSTSKTTKAESAQLNSYGIVNVTIDHIFVSQMKENLSKTTTKKL